MFIVHIHFKSKWVPFRGRGGGEGGGIQVLNSEERSSGGKEHIRETTIVDSAYSYLFMCSNIAALTTPPPL